MDIELENIFFGIEYLFVNLILILIGWIFKIFRYLFDYLNVRNIYNLLMDM